MKFNRKRWASPISPFSPLSHALRLLIFLANACVMGAVQAGGYSQIVLGGFSDDGSKLSLSACSSSSDCKMGYLELPNIKFVALEPEDRDQIWGPGGFSADGSSMAISVRRKSEHGRYSQIGILPLRLRQVTQLTSVDAYSTAPSFSGDAKWVIFSRANRERTSGATRFSDWDIYEITSDGKSELRLTEHRFYQVSPPHFMPGDRVFIFSGDSPRSYRSLLGLEAVRAYKAQYYDNGIFVLPINSNEYQLKPLFVRSPFSADPSVSKDGSKILYVARTDKEDGIRTKYVYDLFLFDGKEHRRVTQLGKGQIAGSVLSPKGDMAAVVMDDGIAKTFDLFLLNIVSGKLSRVDFAL